MSGQVGGGLPPGDGVGGAEGDGVGTVQAALRRRQSTAAAAGGDDKRPLD